VEPSFPSGEGSKDPKPKQIIEAKTFVNNILQIGNSTLDEYNLTTPIHNTISGAISIDDTTLMNAVLGRKGTILTLKGRICTCINLMHLYHEVKVYSLESTKGCLDYGIQRVVDAINNHSKTHSYNHNKFKNDRWLGERLMSVKKKFGWVVFLSEFMTHRTVRYLSKEAFDVALKYVEDEKVIYSRQKNLIDKRLPPESVKSLIIQIVSETLNNHELASTIVNDIDSHK
jgi:hypothetical protein